MGDSLSPEEILALTDGMKARGVVSFDFHNGELRVSFAPPEPPKPEPRRQATPEQMTEYRKALAEYREKLQFAHVEGFPEPPEMP